MNLSELKLIGKAKQSEKYPNLWMARHDGNKVTAMNADTGVHVTVDMDDGLDAQAELETFFAEQGVGKEEREQRRAHYEARLKKPSTVEDGVAEHDVDEIEIGSNGLFEGSIIPGLKGDDA